MSLSRLVAVASCSLLSTIVEALVLGHALHRRGVRLAEVVVQRELGHLGARLLVGDELTPGLGLGVVGEDAADGPRVVSRVTPVREARTDEHLRGAALLVERLRGGDVGRADLEDRGGDLVLLDHLRDDGRRLVRVVGVVLGIDLDLVAPDASVGVGLVGLDLQTPGDLPERRGRAGERGREPDLERRARRVGRRGVSRALRGVDLQRVAAGRGRRRRAPTRRSSWRRRPAVVVAAAAVVVAPPDAAVVVAPEPDLLSLPQAAAMRASATPPITTPAVVRFLMRFLPLGRVR